MPTDLCIQNSVSLKECTSFELGGEARYFAEIYEEKALEDAILWADENEQQLTILGGGSNVLIADEGLEGLVCRISSLGMQKKSMPFGQRWTIAAGESWDRVVAASVEANLAGIECLSGIPGSCGAAPIQNIGAYGQEIAEALHSVRVFDRQTRSFQNLHSAALDFGYRNSRLKKEPNRWIVMAIDLDLRADGPVTLRYPDLEKYIRTLGPPSLQNCRAAVLALRQQKSMILDPADENRRSAGSFFLNPILTKDQVETLTASLRANGLLPAAETLPSFPTPDGQLKVPAAWLIETSGFHRGQRSGQVGLSSQHTLALVHHGGGTSQEMVAFARSIQQKVRQKFGVSLEAEPVLLGFSDNPLA